MRTWGVAAQARELFPTLPQQLRACEGGRRGCTMRNTSRRSCPWTLPLGKPPDPTCVPGQPDFLLQVAEKLTFVLKGNSPRFRG